MKRNLLLLLVTLLPLMANAYDAEIDGIYYNFSGNNAEVTSGSPKYSGSVIIPKSVTYSGKTYSVTSIGEIAFYYCSGLTSITIGNSVTSIGDEAFSGCSGLTSIIIPNSLTNIGDRAFYGCSSLQYNEYSNAYYLGNNENPYFVLIKSKKSDITTCEINASCKIIYTDVIKHQYVGPNSIIGAFNGCSSLTSVTIPKSVTSIGLNAFNGCNGLKKVIVPDISAWCGISFNGNEANPLYYAHHLYSDEETKITNLVIPNSVTSIGNYAFSSCTDLTSVIIPNSVTSIGDYAFHGCSSLTSVNIPNSVTGIGEWAFLDCSGLTSVTIGNSVTNIGSSVFYGCKLRNVLIKCTTPPKAGDKSFSVQTFAHTTLYVPAGCWDAYAYDDAWYKFNIIRETAMSEEEVAEQQAYTLMDAESFACSVYDPVNECIGTINSVSGINEDNPNHCWQVIEAEGMYYLYNIGARKYVKREGSHFALIDTPEPIEVENGSNGIILGAQDAQQWALVSNERMSVAQSAIDEVTGISSLQTSTYEGEQVYDLQGRMQDATQNGINIIRYSDGTTKKVAIK